MDDKMEAGANRSSFGAWCRTLVIGRNPRRTFIRIVTVVAVCFLVREFVLVPIRVTGPSMEPTYHDGAISLANRLAYLRSEPKRGDVVSIRMSNPSLLPPSTLFMKRIVGLPGETLQFRDGHVLIDGRVLEEPYMTMEWDWESPPVKLQPGQYYVVGDNRSMPELSHVEGRIRRNHIFGKILPCKNSSTPSSSSP